MPPSSYKFGQFDLDCARYELRRNGRILKLERIPMELLSLLAEKDGHVVSRQEIIERLWGKDVFVDTEHGINTAIRKIRAALQEDAERPRFVQTVLGKGYRLVAEQKNGDAWQAGSLREVRNSKPTETIPARRRHWWLVPAAGFALCLLVGGVLGFNIAGVRDRIFPPNPRTQIRSIAVLPLTNLSGDPAQDYFADGVTDELITALTKNRSLRVVSRTSTMQYKGVRRPLRDIARELGVDGILEGSLERSGNRVHMTVQLIHAPSDTHNSLAGLYFFGDWDLARADAESVRAISLNPNYAEAHHLRAYILEVMNRRDEALREQKRCTELDQFERPWALGKVLMHLRQFDAAVSELRLRAEAQPQDSGLRFLLADA
jgi:TolB-like protein/DNA-binding winged helix-turn-helix (wHTH) protein